MHKWLLFLPQTPTNPSSLRVLVWRRMQHLGALMLQNGVWILPRSHMLERKLYALQAELEAQGGSGLLFIAQIARPDLEERIIARFSAEREQDYAEFLERCEQFLSELTREANIHKFTFSELDENEEELHKLTQWLHKIHQRDFFGGARHDEATAALTRCRCSLEEYAAQIYLLLGYDPPDTLK